MKFYHSPGSCSLGIHILLHEVGKPFTAHRVKLMEGEQYKPEFTAINPKSKVPTLVRDDGSVLTEYPAIALWLARTNPQARLLPTDVEGEVRAIELTDFAVSTMHMQGFSRMFRPANFAPSEADHDKVRKRGEEIFVKGLSVMDKALDGKPYLLGDFSIADTALFYVCNWWAGRMQKELPPALAAHYARMKQRPATQATLAAEAAA
jgi:glutathione S-transferase